MKKNYVKPELETIMLSPESPMMGGSDGDKIPAIPGEGDEFTNKKDRNWGRDLWGEKE
jgi:hypothetical protein